MFIYRVCAKKEVSTRKLIQLQDVGGKAILPRKWYCRCNFPYCVGFLALHDVTVLLEYFTDCSIRVSLFGKKSAIVIANDICIVPTNQQQHTGLAIITNNFSKGLLETPLGTPPHDFCELKKAFKLINHMHLFF